MCAVPPPKACLFCCSTISAKAVLCHHCGKSQDTSRWRTLNPILTHPLVVLVLATVVGLPSVSAYFAKTQVREQARQQSSLNAVRAASQVERDLNAVQTLFYSFYYDFGKTRLAATDYAAAQHDLRQTLIQFWTNFDRNAWWWHHQLRAEAELTRALGDNERTRFERLLQDYQTNLNDTAVVVDQLWTHFIRESQPDPALSAAVVEKTTKRFLDLAEKRHGISAEIARFFADK